MELTKLKQIKYTGKLPEEYKLKAELLPGYNDGLFNQLSINTAYSDAMAKRTDIPGADLIMKKPTTGGDIQSLQSLASVHPYAAAAAYVLQGVNEGMARVQDNSTLINDAGTSQGVAGGISYTKLNIVNAGDAMSEYDKSMTQSMLSNPFTSLTQLVFRGKLKSEALLAQLKSINTLNYQRSGALTTAARLNNAKVYGDPQSSYLYGAKDGKLPHFLDGVVSAFGEGDFPVTAKVSNGEVMEQDGVMYRAGKGKDSKDTLLAYADGKTTIYPNKGKDRFGMDISDYVWKTGDTDGGLYMLQLYQADKQGGMFYAKNGKLPKFAEGGWGNAAIAGIGALQGLDQYLTARRNKPYRPNTYVDNPYELDALTTLAGLRVNPYPILGQLRNAETRTNRAIDRSGGLSVAQRSLGRLSALNTTQNNIANTLSAIQQQNNQYKANYASSALNAGQAARQARMQANQWDLDYYSKAHAAQLGGMQMGARNILGALQGWQQNDFKRRQFNDTMSLYRSDQKMKQDELDMLARSLNNNIANNTNKLQNSYLDMMLNIPYFGMSPNPYYFGPRMMLNKR